MAHKAINGHGLNKSGFARTIEYPAAIKGGASGPDLDVLSSGWGGVAQIPGVQFVVKNINLSQTPNQSSFFKKWREGNDGPSRGLCIPCVGCLGKGA